MSENASSSPQPPRRRGPANGRSNRGDSTKKSHSKPPGKKSTSSGNRKPKAKRREIKNDYRFLEIVKLMKSYEPVTINGVPVRSIIERAEKAEAEPDAPETTSEKPEAAAKSSDLLLGQDSIKDPVQKFIAKSIAEGSPIYVSLMFPPSDPEFPYDLDILKISLNVPPKYPYDTSVQPSIYVLNDDIPRGFAANIEIGFRDITSLALGKTVQQPEGEGITLAKGRGLLSQIQTLDKNLEYFLKQERKETIKFVKGKKPKSASSTPRATPSATPTPTATPPPPQPTSMSYSGSNTLESSRLIPQHPIRKQNIDALTHKIPCKLFTKNDRENVYRIELPVSAAAIEPPKSWVKNKYVDVRLHVPVTYPKENAWITIPAQMLNKISTDSKHRSSENELITPTQLEEFAKQAMMERQELSRAAKSLEKNFKRIPDILSSTREDLVSLLNFAANNLGALCLGEKECSEVFTMLK